MSAEPAHPTLEGLPLPQERFLNREESWLQFNQRVLEMAEDPSLPLLERVRFLAIFASNLDEFFRVRVAGLKRRMATGLLLRTKSGLKPREELARIAAIADDLAQRHSTCFQERVLPQLAAEDIEIVRWDDLGREERSEMRKLFRERVRPVLTPLAVDPAHPFPYISGLSLNLAVTVRNPSSGHTVFARVKVPSQLPRFVAASKARFVPLEDVIAAHLGQLFKGMEIVEHHVFRVTRNEDLDVDEDVTENLMQALERELLKRRFGPPVRLEVEDTITPEVLDLLVEELGVADHEIYRLPGPLDLTGLHAIADLERGELSFRPFVPAEVVHVDDDIFAVLRERDVLLHHPYDSFSTSVQRFIEQAAADPNVLAIKQTLYRTSGDSPIVDALVDAAEAGKQVVVVVEIKARFDEHANITWARKLERAGCHVVYGVVGLKTHCKLALVVRQEPSGELRSYCHIGTGNYNPKTARHYEDLGLLTADRLVGEDVTDLFIHLTGYSNHSAYRRLLVAPHSLRGGLLARIEREISHQEAGRPARIRMKTNSLVDEPIIDALYRASQAGVPVDLWVRGVCTLRPGVPGLSENIRVRSVLGRFLEHSRIYEFGHGRRPEIWIGSGDVMRRNLERRVEALVKVASQQQRVYLSELLDRGMSDDTLTWWLNSDGTWTRHRGEDLQTHLISTRRWRTIDD
ncbi:MULTISPECIES: RNA degradosome polyphosphate kinase [Streptosporangium]|uniref:Polyphosphate kinase n=1 Tax=Streptosporangium subroseum TaxID=106412 RepID=A0A239P3E8_9ACTN|nr:MULTISPECIES: RNA degradosome polyphosphate kinase [Streptosporangium]AWS46843.1 RNA degradosome polyphosphate kinase [Streptosporangium sp. 'caverna']SNT61164.1 polyphosphate kinase [Streptosporangium subroseum]